MKAKNEILESRLEFTNSIIEGQNAHMEKMNSYFQLFIGILGIIIAVAGFFTYFQYIRPANKLHEEAKELQKESREILNDLKGGMREVFEEKYDQITKERFYSAIEILKKGDFRAQEHARIVIRDYEIMGFNDDEISKIIECLVYTEENRPDVVSDLNTFYSELVTKLSKERSNKMLDEFFGRFLNNKTYTLGCHGAVYYYCNNNPIKYKNELHKAFKIKHDGSGQKYHVFFSFIHEIENATKIDPVNLEILNDRDFVNEIEKKGFLNEIIHTYDGYKKKPNFKSKSIYEYWPILNRPTYLKERIDNLLKVTNGNSK